MLGWSYRLGSFYDTFQFLSSSRFFPISQKSSFSRVYSLAKLENEEIEIESKLTAAQRKQQQQGGAAAAAASSASASTAAGIRGRLR